MFTIAVVVSRGAEGVFWGERSIQGRSRHWFLEAIRSKVKKLRWIWDKYPKMDRVKLFKSWLSRILLGPFLNTLSHLIDWWVKKNYTWLVKANYGWNGTNSDKPKTVLCLTWISPLSKCCILRTSWKKSSILFAVSLGKRPNLSITKWECTKGQVDIWNYFHQPSTCGRNEGRMKMRKCLAWPFSPEEIIYLTKV